MMNNTTINEPLPATQNEGWGFYGTMGEYAVQAWPLALRAIACATREDVQDVRAFLDSRPGRHFADEVRGNLHRGLSLADAIAATVDQWMRWRTTRRHYLQHGTPVGIPYLAAQVINEAMAAGLHG